MQVKSFYLSLDKASDMFDPKKIKFATIPWEELEKEFPVFSKSEAFRQAEAYIWEKEISELFAEVYKSVFRRLCARVSKKCRRKQEKGYSNYVDGSFHKTNCENPWCIFGTGADIFKLNRTRKAELLLSSACTDFSRFI